MKSQIKILIAILILTFSIYPQSKRLTRKIDKVLNHEFLAPANIGIEVYNLTKKKTIYSHNSEKLFIPASNLKIITSASAMIFLPEDFTFNISFRANGAIVDSTLFGDLIIKGNGDPHFSESDFTFVIKALRQNGINRITGNLIADLSWDDSLFFGKGWMWDDNPEPFMPYISSLNINNGVFDVIVSPGKINTPVNVKVIPTINSISIENNSITAETDSSTIKINRDWINHTNNISVTGTLSPKTFPDTMQVNMFDSPYIFLEAMKQKLKENEIMFFGEMVFEKKVSYTSKLFEFQLPIDTVLIDVNKNSNNLSAEVLLRAIGVEKESEPSRITKSMKYVDSLISLSGNLSSNYEIVDGSGISRYNLISPKLLIDILLYLNNERPEEYKRLINSLPISGIDGTLNKRLKSYSAIGKVRAKTGTMTGISSLTGILTNKYNEEIIFSIMINNFVGDVVNAQILQDRICRILINNR